MSLVKMSARRNVIVIIFPFTKSAATKFHYDEKCLWQNVRLRNVRVKNDCNEMSCDDMFCDKINILWKNFNVTKGPCDKRPSDEMCYSKMSYDKIYYLRQKVINKMTFHPQCEKWLSRIYSHSHTTGEHSQINKDVELCLNCVKLL